MLHKVSDYKRTKNCKTSFVGLDAYRSSMIIPIRGFPHGKQLCDDPLPILPILWPDTLQELTNRSFMQLLARCLVG